MKCQVGAAQYIQTKTSANSSARSPTLPAGMKDVLIDSGLGRLPKQLPERRAQAADSLPNLRFIQAGVTQQESRAGSLGHLASRFRSVRPAADIRGDLAFRPRRTRHLCNVVALTHWTDRALLVLEGVSFGASSFTVEAMGRGDSGDANEKLIQSLR
jgi:hypothetical protein